MAIAEFEVQSFQEITGRGVFVLGQIREGKIKVGSRTVPLEFSDGKSRQLRIKSIDFADRISTKESWIAIGFEERKNTEELSLVMPVGSVLEFEEAE